jgi:hypothetical protein
VTISSAVEVALLNDLRTNYHIRNTRLHNINNLYVPASSNRPSQGLLTEMLPPMSAVVDDAGTRFLSVLANDFLNINIFLDRQVDQTCK